MAQHVVGATADELRAVRETMRRMLKENGAPPEGRFADLKYLEPVRDYKARHASTMLTFDAVVDAIDQIEKKRGGARRPELPERLAVRNLERRPRICPATGPARGARRRAGFSARSIVRLYQLTLSGFIGNSCRHLPTCSEYADEAIARHGLWAGGWMAAVPRLRAAARGARTASTGCRRRLPTATAGSRRGAIGPIAQDSAQAHADSPPLRLADRALKDRSPPDASGKTHPRSFAGLDRRRDMSNTVSLTFPDGSVRDYDAGDDRRGTRRIDLQIACQEGRRHALDGVAARPVRPARRVRQDRDRHARRSARAGTDPPRRARMCWPRPCRSSGRARR